MSLTGALQASTSGLRTAQMQSEATSRNIANASTEGYVRKELPQVTTSGGLVQTGEARREVDASLNRMYRQHSSAMAREQAIYEAVGATRTLPTPPYPSTHNLGTNRMSENPRDGVVNKHGQTHDVPNLFISDGSQFTTGAAENPTLTIVALAIRQADFIAGELSKGNI